MDVKFREATSTDYDGIMSMSQGIYQGKDTLSDDFKVWLASADWFQYVGEHGSGKIVAFVASNVVDGAESVTIRSSRVDPHYRGRGIYKSLIAFTEAQIRKELPNFKRIYRLKESQVNIVQGYEKVHVLGLLMASFKGCNLQDVEKQISNSEVEMENLTWQEFRAFYDSEETMRSLFAGDLMGIHANIYSLRKHQNWKYFEEVPGIRLLLTRYDAPEGESNFSLSLIQSSKCNTNEGVPVLRVNSYGANTLALRCHLAQAVREGISQHGQREFLLVVWLPNELKMDCVKLMQELSSNPDEIYEKEMNLMCQEISE